LRSKNLEFHKSQNRVYFGHTAAREIFNINFKPKTLAFQIVKGGTGKTSIAHSVAIRANLYGARILCIDLDQQGNLTQSLNVNAENLPVFVDMFNSDLHLEDLIINVSPGLDLIPSRIENAILDNVLMLKRLPLDRVYRDKIQKIRKNYDFIIFDCPPNLGQSVSAAALASDMLIAPVTPEEFSLSGLKITLAEIQNIEETYKVNIPFKAVLNKFDIRTSLSHEVLSMLIKHPIFGEKLFRSYIRSSQEFPNSITNHGSIFDTLRSSQAREDIDLLTREILNLNNKDKYGVSLGTLGEAA
jgi:chromosome partitioning protein